MIADRYTRTSFCVFPSTLASPTLRFIITFPMSVRWCERSWQCPTTVVQASTMDCIDGFCQLSTQKWWKAGKPSFLIYHVHCKLTWFQAEHRWNHLQVSQISYGNWKNMERITLDSRQGKVNNIYKSWTSLLLRWSPKGFKLMGEQEDMRSRCEK